MEQRLPDQWQPDTRPATIIIDELIQIHFRTVSVVIYSLNLMNFAANLQFYFHFKQFITFLQVSHISSSKPLRQLTYFTK